MIDIVRDETDALREAVTLALAETAGGLQEGPGRFRPVAMGTTRPVEARRVRLLRRGQRFRLWTAGVPGRHGDQQRQPELQKYGQHGRVGVRADSDGVGDRPF